jgi:molybdate transport system substrate-binding protein
LSYLTEPSVRFISIADPDLAPYGKAAVQTLQALHLWEQVKSKVVYATNISMARQHAESGNADAAFTASSLLRSARGAVIIVEEKLHAPIDQALGILTSSSRQNEANRFRAFVMGPAGTSILSRYGYIRPPATAAVAVP